MVDVVLVVMGEEFGALLVVEGLSVIGVVMASSALIFSVTTASGGSLVKYL